MYYIMYYTPAQKKCSKLADKEADPVTCCVIWPVVMNQLFNTLGRPSISLRIIIWLINSQRPSLPGAPGKHINQD